MNKKNVQRHKWLILYLVLFSAVVGAGWFATRYLGDMARQEIVNENEASITLFSTLLTDDFKRIEGAVKAMSGSPWIPPALISGKDQDIARANDVLDRYNSAMRGSVSYLMDSAGKTIASSNRNDPDSFVGKSYQFRPYFAQAINGNRGRYFGLGITSLKRGFYASFPVRDGRGKIIGVVVMKGDLDDIEAYISGHSHFFFINNQGVIFLSNRKEMLFKSLWPVGRETERALLASKQFGEKPFEAVLSQEIAEGMDVTLNGNLYYVSRRVVDPEGWSVVLMTPTDQIKFYKFVGILATTFIGFLIIFLSGIIYVTGRSKEAIRQSEESKRLLLHAVGEGIFGVDAKEQLTFVNPAALSMLGFSVEEMLGQNAHALIHHSHKDGSNYPVEDCPMHASYTKATENRVAEEVLWRKDGSSFPVDYASTPIIKDSRVIGVVVNFKDITERKRMEDEIRSLSITDQLTGLSNRRGFLALAEQQLKIADRTKKDILFVYIDLDGMKWINDNLGHKEGDNALIEVAAVLKETFRSSDIIARMGGDEFAVLAIDMAEGSTDIHAARLQDQIDMHNSRENRGYKLSISVGCSCYDPANPCSIDELMVSADERMYEQKRSKKS
jgi:diguanylate cyclase (GGDEF)-like protein/PAS domain S-box-containing protein